MEEECTDKKKTKFSSYIRKFRKGHAVAKSYIITASSYMTKYLRISSYIRKNFLVYMTFQLLPSEFPYIEESFILFFISVDGENKGEIIDETAVE